MNAINYIGTFFLGGMTGILILAHIEEPAWKNFESKAVERGAATWVVDPKTGKTTFTWTEVKQ